LAAYINQLLEPTRKHFETDPTARELLNKVKILTEEAEAEKLKAQAS